MKVLIFCMIALTSCSEQLHAQQAVILTSVKESGNAGIFVTVSWILTRSYPSVTVSWDSVNYSSEVNLRFVGRNNMKDSTIRSFSIPQELKFDHQYRFCVEGTDFSCPQQDFVCTFVKVDRPKKFQKEPQGYMMLGPVHSTNVTVSWSRLEKQNAAYDIKNGISYYLSWKKIAGRIDGHPGHSSQVVSQTHYVKGLLPATRYEFCVTESKEFEDLDVCDVITTEEDVPGPPIADECSCFSQAKGTHWRCEFSWSAPRKTNGRIKSYTIFWKDDDEYSLGETTPSGALCQPFCVDSQVLSFHPTQVCVRARTSKGIGWEDCVKVEDVSGRILAFFELKVLLIVLSTLFVYIFGFAILRGCFKCCVRSLYGIIENGKEHPV